MTHDAPAYGLWSLEVINIAIFAYSFTRPRTVRDWRHLRCERCGCAFHDVCYWKTVPEHERAAFAAAPAEEYYHFLCFACRS